MVTFGGVSLRVPDADLEAFIADNFDLRAWRPFPRRGDISMPCGWLHYEPYEPPVPRLGEFTWPADPHAYATGYFLITQAGLDQLEENLAAATFYENALNFGGQSYGSASSKLNNYFKFIIDDGRNESTEPEDIAERQFKCWLRIAATHCVSEDLYIVALADERYWWNGNRQWIDDGAIAMFELPGDDTEFLPNDAIPGGGVTLSDKVIVDVVPAVYGYMSKGLWNSWNSQQSSWIAFYLNHAAMYGGRWACTPRVLDPGEFQSSFPTRMRLHRPDDALSLDEADRETFLPRRTYGGTVEEQTSFAGYRYARFIRFGVDVYGELGDDAALGPKRRIEITTPAEDANAQTNGEDIVLFLPIAAERGIATAVWNAVTQQAFNDHTIWLRTLTDATYAGVANFSLHGTIHSLVFSVLETGIAPGMQAIRTRVVRYPNGVTPWTYTGACTPPEQIVRVVTPAFEEGDYPHHEARIVKWNDTDGFLYDEAIKIVTPSAGRTDVEYPDEDGNARHRSGMQKHFMTLAKPVGQTEDGIPVYAHSQHPVIPFQPNYADDNDEATDWTNDPNDEREIVVSANGDPDPSPPAAISETFLIGPTYWLPLFHNDSYGNGGIVVQETDYLWRLFLQVAMTITCGATDNVTIRVWGGWQTSSDEFASLTDPEAQGGIIIANLCQRFSYAPVAPEFKQITIPEQIVTIPASPPLTIPAHTSNPQSFSGNVPIRHVTGDVTFAEFYADLPPTSPPVSGTTPTIRFTSPPEDIDGVLYKNIESDGFPTWKISRLLSFEHTRDTIDTAFASRPSTANVQDIGVKARPWLCYQVFGSSPDVHPQTFSWDSKTGYSDGYQLYGNWGGTVTFEGHQPQYWGVRLDGTHHEWNTSYSPPPPPPPPSNGSLTVQLKLDDGDGYYDAGDATSTETVNYEIRSMSNGSYTLVDSGTLPITSLSIAPGTYALVITSVADGFHVAYVQAPSVPHYTATIFTVANDGTITPSGTIAVGIAATV